MSTVYTFGKPLDMMLRLASALTVRNCIISGSGTDAACSAYVSSALVPLTFRRIAASDFRNVDSMISAAAPYFCDSDGVRWTMRKLESVCGAADIQPGATSNPLPAEWLRQRFDMISRLNIAGGGVMTRQIDGFAWSPVSYADALTSAVAAASSGGEYSGFQASRCLVFEHAGDYAASATLTVSGVALSPAETPVWGNPRRIFRLSAFRDTHEAFYAGQIAVNGGTMTVTEGVNTFDAGTAGTYRFLDPVYPVSGEHAEAGMTEFTGDSVPVLLQYDL